MKALLDSVALLVTAAGLLAGLGAFLASRSPTAGLGVFLEMALAAGLLRLTADPSPRRAATAAGLLVVRRLLLLGLRVRQPAAVLDTGAGASTSKS